MPSDSGRGGRKIKKPFDDGHSLYDTVQRFWIKSYAGDYMGFSILFALFMILKLSSEPFHQQFRLNDPRIQHPHAEIERVPVRSCHPPPPSSPLPPSLTTNSPRASLVWLFIYAAILPASVLALWALTFRPTLHKAHILFLGLGITIVSTLFLTDLFKDAIGRPRPDLIARCRPDPHTSLTDQISVADCTQTDHHVLHDGWRSYPSGHSSFSFAGLGWLAMFFASQTHALRPRASLLVVLLCVAPLLLAALIAISRLEDYRHDVFDVISGAVLGFAIAWFNWRRYFPSLTSGACDEPYGPPSSGRASPSGGAFQRVRDEEEGRAMEMDRYSPGHDAGRYRSPDD